MSSVWHPRPSDVGYGFTVLIEVVSKCHVSVPSVDGVRSEVGEDAESS